MKVISVCFFALLNISVEAFSAPNPERFEFEKAAAIYHLVKDGGIIYLRPNEYNEAQGFIRIYETLDQYLFELEMLNSNAVFALDEQPLIDEFVLVNGTGKKRYLLKDGWLGDGDIDKWVPMSPEDYSKLKDVIDERKKIDGSKTTAEGLENFTARIQDAAQENEIPRFESQFNRNDEEKVVAVLKSNGQDSSNNGNTSDLEEAITYREDGRSESANLTVADQERIAKELPIGSNKKFLGEADLQNNSQVQENRIQEIVSSSNWKWLAIFAFLIAGCIKYVQRKR